MKEWIKRLKQYYFNAYVVVSFSSQLVFVFVLFWGRLMYANEIETKEK